MWRVTNPEKQNLEKHMKFHKPRFYNTKLNDKAEEKQIVWSLFQNSLNW